MKRFCVQRLAVSRTFTVTGKLGTDEGKKRCSAIYVSLDDLEDWVTDHRRPLHMPTQASTEVARAISAR